MKSYSDSFIDDEYTDHEDFSDYLDVDEVEIRSRVDDWDDDDDDFDDDDFDDDDDDFDDDDWEDDAEDDEDDDDRY